MNHRIFLLLLVGVGSLVSFDKNELLAGKNNPRFFNKICMAATGGMAVWQCGKMLTSSNHNTTDSLMLTGSLVACCASWLSFREYNRIEQEASDRKKANECVNFVKLQEQIQELLEPEQQNNSRRLPLECNSYSNPVESSEKFMRLTNSN